MAPRGKPPGRWNALALALILGTAVALAVRVSVRDALPVLDLVYYASPWPALALPLSAAGVIWWRAGHAARSAICLLAAGSLLAAWGVDLAGRDRCAHDPAGLTLVTWNIEGGKHGWQRIARELAASEADVIGLVEARIHPARDAEFWAERLPGYRYHPLDEGLIVLTRGRVVSSRFHRFGKRSRCGVVDLVVSGRSLRVVLVDIEGDLTSRRKSLLAELRDLVAGGDAEVASEGAVATPRVLMGDFNTPADSVWFGETRASFTNALEAGGRGSQATWPRPAPLLAIDHIWVDGLQVVCADTSFSGRSDHGMVRATVTSGGAIAQRCYGTRGRG